MPFNRSKIRVEVPQRSGFDKSHRNSGTSFTGTLTPLLCDELIPNSRVSLRIPINVSLPPLVSQTYMNVKYKVEAFFVPSRLLCKSFEDFFNDFPKRVYTNSAYNGSTSSGAFADITAAVPTLTIGSSAPSTIYGAGSLLDYLGFKADTVSTSYTINMLPLIAYHLVWQEFYRNPRVQNPAFAEDLGAHGLNSEVGYKRVCSAPYNYYHRAFVGDGDITLPDNSSHQVNSSDNLAQYYTLADGTSFFALRQRNFGLDYFTGARLNAQQGAASTVTIDVLDDSDVPSSYVGKMSIAALRAANSLQQFRERNNLPSPRLVDQVKARYGANLSDGVAQRPICIGTAGFDVFTSGVAQTSPSTSGTTSDSNPFSSVAAEYGRASANGSEFIINDFVANEPGYLLVLGSLVPEVSYSSGVLPMFRHYLTEGSITDMACGLLQNVGDQPIYSTELGSVLEHVDHPAYVVAYTDRYADFMFMPNQIHGEFRDGQSLDSFVLQRSFTYGASLSSSFLEIPTTYLDQVFAVTSATQGLSYWYDAILQYKVTMPLAEYSLPSLQDPAYEHGESVVLRRNGQIF